LSDGKDSELTVETPSGPARVHVSPARVRVGGPAAGGGLLVLGHGAGGGVDTRDLLALRDAATSAGWTVARVEQPYRVAERRAPAPAPQLDAAWTAVVAELRRERHRPLVVGGRSSGARVACRTAAAVGADAVVCLAFPLRPPQRPERCRAAELLAVTVPVLVVQGERDPFGRPGDLPAGVDVLAVAGDHSLRTGADAMAHAVTDWLARLQPVA
jgi:predicted alpha/beta-hydrolase family hydrolase